MWATNRLQAHLAARGFCRFVTDLCPASSEIPICISTRLCEVTLATFLEVLVSFLSCPTRVGVLGMLAGDVGDAAW